MPERSDKWYVDEVQKLVNSQKQYRNYLYESWYNNYAFVMNEHWVKVHPQRKEIENDRLKENKENWITRETINVVGAKLRTRLGKALQNEPIVKVIPGSAEDEDMLAAELAELYLLHTYFYGDDHPRIVEAILLSMIAGTSYWEESWSKSKNEEIVRIWHPSRIYFPTGLANHDDANLFVTKWLLTKEELNRLIRDGNGLAEELTDDEKNPYNTPNANLDSFEADMARLLEGGKEMRTSDRFEVMRWYEKPHDDEKGGIIYIRDEKVINKSPFPFDHSDMLPIVVFKDFPVPGRLHGKSFIDDMRGQQKALNKMVSQVTQWNNKALLGAPIGIPSTIEMKKVDEDNLTTPGAVIYYEPGANGEKPERLPMTELPAYLPQLIQFALTSLDIVSGVRQVSEGGGTPEASGYALAIRKQMDDLDLLPIAREYDKSLSKAAWLRLRHCRQFKSEKTLCQIFGEYSTYKVKVFKGTKLPEQLDVVVHLPSFSEGKTAQVLKTMDMVRLAILQPATNPRDKRATLRLLNLGPMAVRIDPTLLDEERAIAENLKIEKGVWVEVQPYDDHEIHCEVVMRPIKSPDFEEKPKEIQSLYLAHWADHKIKLSTKQDIDFEKMVALGKGASQAKVPGLPSQPGGGPALMTEGPMPALGSSPTGGI